MFQLKRICLVELTYCSFNFGLDILLNGTDIIFTEPYGLRASARMCISTSYISLYILEYRIYNLSYSVMW